MEPAISQLVSPPVGFCCRLLSVENQKQVEGLKLSAHFQLLISKRNITTANPLHTATVSLLQSGSMLEPQLQSFRFDKGCVQAQH